MTIMSSPTVTASTKPPRSKLRVSDVVATGTHGLRSRKGRTLLTAVGIAIGIASMIAVLGISASVTTGTV